MPIASNIMLFYYEMPRTTASRLSKYTSKRGSKRRAGPNIAKVKYQAPTARHQKSQILANARILASHSRQLRTHKVFSDWQLTGGLLLTTDAWSVIKLTDFSDWNSVLRQDPVVIEKSHTFIARMQLNMRYTLNDADYCGFNVFIVTMRRNATNIDPFTTPPVVTRDWIEPAQDQGFNLRLNSGIYKVHYARYITLTENALNVAQVAGAQAGNPYSTWKKGQINLPLRMSVTQPALFGTGIGAWRDLAFEDLPYYHKYYLMVYPTFVNTGAGTNRPSVSYDGLAVCINAA